MDEKKIIIKSIDEQLAELEKKEALEARAARGVSASGRRSVAGTAANSAKRASAAKTVDQAPTANNVKQASTGSATGRKRSRKKLRLKKSVRRTIGSLMLATSVVVAAVPVGGVSADSTGEYKGSMAEAEEIDSIADNTSADTDTVNTHVNKTTSDHYGGFPIIAEYDTDGNFKPRSIGGRDFFVVVPKQPKFARAFICSSIPSRLSLNHHPEPNWILPFASVPWKLPSIVPKT